MEVVGAKQKVVEIVLPREVQERLEDALEAAGTREIGGVLMGECVAPNRFRVADVTIQRRGGKLRLVRASSW